MERIFLTAAFTTDLYFRCSLNNIPKDHNIGQISQVHNANICDIWHKGAFKYYAILLGGGGGSPKRSQKITRGGGGVHQKITEDHDHRGGEQFGHTEGAKTQNI